MKSVVQHAEYKHNCTHRCDCEWRHTCTSITVCSSHILGLNINCIWTYIDLRPPPSADDFTPCKPHLPHTMPQWTETRYESPYLTTSLMFTLQTSLWVFTEQHYLMSHIIHLHSTPLLLTYLFLSVLLVSRLLTSGYSVYNLYSTKLPFTCRCAVKNTANMHLLLVMLLAEHNIAELWKNHFAQLYNSVNCENDAMIFTKFLSLIVMARSLCA